jgi:hypothetical protein
VSPGSFTLAHQIIHIAYLSSVYYLRENPGKEHPGRDEERMNLIDALDRLGLHAEILMKW